MQFLKLLVVLCLASQFTEAVRFKILLQREVEYSVHPRNRLRRDTCTKSCIKSSSCQCIGYEKKMNYTFPSYIGSLDNNSYVEVFQSSDASSHISDLLERKIAGSDLTAKDIIDGLETIVECKKILIFGGCIRDIVRGVHLDDINDIDFEVFCNSNVVLQHCEQKLGSTLCELGTNENWVTIGEKNSNKVGQTTMDAVPLTIVYDGYFQNPNYLEFTTNSLFYDRNDNVIIDVSGTGMEDTCECYVRIPNGANKDTWNSLNISFGYGLKRYRYFKLLVKGFTAVENTKNFVVAEIKREIETDNLSFFLCEVVVKAKFAAHKCKHTDSTQCSRLEPYKEQLKDQLGATYYDDKVESKIKSGAAAPKECQSKRNAVPSIIPDLSLLTLTIVVILTLTMI